MRFLYDVIELKAIDRLYFGSPRSYKYVGVREAAMQKNKTEKPRFTYC